MGKKILIVDDDALFRAKLTGIIRSRLKDFEILQAGDGYEALVLTKQARPDLVILEVMMPGMNGYEVCRKIKKEHINDDSKIMFVTSRSGPFFQKTIEKLGVAHYLHKPFKSEELVSKIKDAIEN